jgi:hypothetical protein
MIEFDTLVEKDFCDTYSKLIRFNGGFFKSIRQREYVKKTAAYRVDPQYYGSYCSSRGIQPLKEGQFCNTVTYFTRWADYGRKSIRHAEYFYIFDDFGIVEQYRISCYGIETGGGFNKEKTKRIWARDENALLPIFVEPVDTRVNEYVGSVGDKKFQVTGTVKQVKNHYGDIGFIQTMTEYVDIEDADGRLVVLKSSKYTGLEVGVKLTFQGTIIKQEEYKGRKQTTLNRCKILERSDASTE